jgi:replication initiation protein RepC
LALKRDRAGDLVVFASNKMLSLKANGMDIRTLRRRLANLIENGIIRRRSSPNGKRYAHQDAAGNVITAYGLDISPLLERLHEFRERVALEQERQAIHKVARDRLSLLRMSFPVDSEEDIILRTALRRRSTTTAQMEYLIELFTAVNDVEAQPNDLDALADTAILSATHGQNDLHLQSSKQNTYERKKDIAVTKPATPKKPMQKNDKSENLKLRPNLEYHDVMSACPEAMCFAKEEPRSWTDLYAFSRWLAPMIGIKSNLVDQAEQALGKTNLAMTILAIVQMSGSIRNPGAYLRSLFQGPRSEGYCATRYIRSLMRHP